MKANASGRSRAANIDSLDGLRGVAIALVMAFHYRRTLVPGGFVGVDLFFVISGYVITLSILREVENRSSFGIIEFYRRRILRLYPALTCLIVIALTVPMSGIGNRGNDMVAATTTVVGAWNWTLALGHSDFTSLVHIWSLSVELQFYLAWPVLLILMLRRLTRERCALILGTMSLAMALWTYYLASDGAPWYRTYYGTDARAQALLIGCVLALIPASGLVRAAQRLWPLAVAGLLLISASVEITGATLGLGGISLVAVLAGSAAAAAVGTPRNLLRRGLELAPLQWLGLRSYSLFLWHIPVAYGAHAMFPRYWLPVATVGSLAIAEISYRLLERPFLRRRQWVRGDLPWMGRPRRPSAGSK